MGLLKVAATALSSELHDQWKDFIQCIDMDRDTLMIRKSTPNGVITKGSAIMVSPGQIAVIFESGRIIDATAEEGIYTFDESTSPSFFAGQFGEVFKDMWSRFVYGGAVSKQQYVYFFNAKEIMDNKFGTPNPISYRDYTRGIPNRIAGGIQPLSLKVRCFGNYVFKIVDPAAFMRTYAGTAEILKKDEIEEHIRTEVSDLFEKVVNGIGNVENPVAPDELPGKKDEIKKYLAEHMLDETPLSSRGLAITEFVIQSVTPDEESQKRITEYENNSNAYMQQGRVLDVMETAAGNANGAGAGFMGVGMMNMATGGMNGAVMHDAFSAPTQQSPAEKPEDKLAKVKALLDQGLISQEDYDKAKAEVLKQIAGI